MGVERPNQKVVVEHVFGIRRSYPPDPEVGIMGMLLLSPEQQTELGPGIFRVEPGKDVDILPNGETTIIEGDTKKRIWGSDITISYSNKISPFITTRRRSKEGKVSKFLVKMEAGRVYAFGDEFDEDGNLIARAYAKNEIPSPGTTFEPTPLVLTYV